MKRPTFLFCSSSALLLVLAGRLLGQNPPDVPATPNPGTAAASRSPIATPGMQRTPSAPEEGFGKFSTPAAPRAMTQEDRSRVTPAGSSMPTGYPGMQSAGPTDPADCSNNGWTKYSNPKFKSQKNCETWVRNHGTTSPQTGATPRSGMTNPSGSTGSSAARTPSARTTPASPQPR